MKLLFRALIFLLGCGLPGWSGDLSLSWTNNLLTISAPNIPGEKIEVWYLEAFCRTNAHHQSWDKTKIPHQTRLVKGSTNVLVFVTTIGPSVEMTHTIRTGEDEVDFGFELFNRGTMGVDIDWFQPACIRVANFTGRQQSNFIERSFIYTAAGLTPLSSTRRREEALYRGGQVYLPAGINHSNANPRPINLDTPTNGLIGAISRDDRWILATASDQTHELFEGVYVCLHSDPKVGGLKPGEKKRIRSKVYLMTNDPPALLQRYQRDFGSR